MTSDQLIDHQQRQLIEELRARVLHHQQVIALLREALAAHCEQDLKTGATIWPSYPTAAAQLIQRANFAREKLGLPVPQSALAHQGAQGSGLSQCDSQPSV